MGSTCLSPSWQDYFYHLTEADQCIFGILEVMMRCSLRWLPNIQGKDGSVGKSKKPREAVVLSIMEDTLRVQFVGNKYLDCFRWGHWEVRMTRWFSHQFGGAEELKIVIFQQSWKYGMLIDAVLYKKSRVNPQLWWTWGWMLLILSKWWNVKNVQQKMFSCLLAFFPPHKSILKKESFRKKSFLPYKKPTVG